jgi:hypothetical protein
MDPVDPSALAVAEAFAKGAKKVLVVEDSSHM